MGGHTETFGDITPIYCPDPDEYDAFEVVDEVKGEEGLPTVSWVAKFGKENTLLSVRCPFDLQAHYGKCQDPTDFDGGWDKILAFERARLTGRSSDELTAFTPDGRAEILLTGDITARKFWEVDPLIMGERADDVVFNEVLDVAICDNPSCGDCGSYSDGCQAIFAIVAGSGLQSPGIPPELVYSLDKGATWADEDIDTLVLGEDPNAIECVGDLIVVTSHDSCSLHYAYQEDLDAWEEVPDGFVPGNCPLDIWSYGVRFTWIVGENGYIYFTDNPADGVEVQDEGNATNQNLNAVHGLSENFVVAVGQGNSVVFTENGGVVWAAATAAGLHPGANLLCVWVYAEYCWFVGDDSGRLWYSLDKGENWIQKPFPGHEAGYVRDIKFVDHNNSPFGYMVHDREHLALVDGRILRTLNGGYSWYVLPDGPGAMPDNLLLNAVAVCEDPNFVVGVGDKDGLDGIVVVGA